MIDAAAAFAAGVGLVVIVWAIVAYRREQEDIRGVTAILKARHQETETHG